MFSHASITILTFLFNLWTLRNRTSRNEMRNQSVSQPQPHKHGQPHTVRETKMKYHMFVSYQIIKHDWNWKLRWTQASKCWHELCNPASVNHFMWIMLFMIFSRNEVCRNIRWSQLVTDTDTEQIFGWQTQWSSRKNLLWTWQSFFCPTMHHATCKTAPKRCFFCLLC